MKPRSQGYPPHYETQDKRLIELARRNSSDDESFGRLLHHIANCPKCLKTSRRLP